MPDRALSARSVSTKTILAFLPVVVALGVEWLFDAALHPFVWFLFYPAVFISAWIGGRGIGLAATAVSTLLVWWFFVPPQHAFLKEDLRYLLPAGVFAATGVLFSLFHDRLWRIEQRYRALVDQAPEGVFIADPQGRYTDVNDAACRLLGCSRDEVVGRSIRDVIPAQDVDRFWGAKVMHGRTTVGESSLLRNDGTYLPVEISATLLRDGRWQAFVRDIARRRRSEAELRQAAIVFHGTTEAILITDAGARVVAVNAAFTAISGYAPEEVMGRNPRFQKSGRHDEAFYAAMWESLNATGKWQGEIWNRRKRGDIYPAWMNVSAVKDARGTVTHYVSLLSDISAMKEVVDRLDHLAHHDPLTGLPNRLLFTATLGHALDRAQRHRQIVALLFLDLDRFKLINDTLGHPAGDQLLVEVSGRLRRCIRAQDMVARVGGDEFVIVLEDLAAPHGAAQLARKVLAAVAEPLMLDGKEVVTTTSIGIALYPDDGGNAVELTRAADAAMYGAKERGRQTFEFYTAEITARSRERLRVENGLRNALTQNGLVLHYQPQFDIDGRRIIGVEALVRWRQADGSLMLPDAFIPVAEESRLISLVGTWVIQGACLQTRRWLDAGVKPQRMAINLSGRQIAHDQLVETMQQALDANGLRPGDIVMEVEITETVLQSMEHSAEVLRRLHALGVRIAIDDFGTGYSSLSLLKHLPVDTLKIDRVFIGNLPEDPDSSAITAGMIALAHRLGLRVVAEGVETEGQLAFLRQHGCDCVQGFLLSAVLPPEEIEHLLRSQ